LALGKRIVSSAFQLSGRLSHRRAST